MTIWVVELPSERHVGLIWNMDFSSKRMSNELVYNYNEAVSNATHGMLLALPGPAHDDTANDMAPYAPPLR